MLTKTLLKKLDGFKFIRRNGRTFASYKQQPYVEITDVFVPRSTQSLQIAER